MIRFDRVRFGYGGRWILDDISLEVGPGLTLVLGPNGAGKSTLLRIAAGVERPHSGSVSVGGMDLWADEVAARRVLAYLPEYPDLTPYARLGEVVELVCRLRGQPPAIGAAALTRAGLADLTQRTVRQLSLGQRRRALLAAAWVGTPLVLILDEPLDGMDQAMQRQIVEWVEVVAAGGATVLAATHQIEPFLAMASRAVQVGGGSVSLRTDPPEDIRARRAWFASMA